MALDPRGNLFGTQMIIPLLGAILFAGYVILTRIASRTNSAETSFFWTGMVGAIGMSLVGPWHGPHHMALTGCGCRYCVF